MSKAYVILAALLSANVVTAASQAELSVHPAKTLPGQAVTLSARVTAGDLDVKLSRFVRVLVTTRTVDFVAKWGNGKDSGALDFIDDTQEVVTIPAHSAMDVFVTAKPWSAPSWIVDDGLTKPGQYRLRLQLYSPDDQSTPVIVSSPGDLEVASPSSRDADIWESVATGKLGPDLAEHVLATSPESSYLPYLSGFFPRETTLDRIALCRRILALHPNSPVAPGLRLWLAAMYGSESERTFAIEDNLDRAVALAEEERTVLEMVARGSDEASVLEARRRLDDGIPTRAGFLERREMARKTKVQ